MCPAPLAGSKNLQNVFAFTTASPRKSGLILRLDRPRVSPPPCPVAQKARNNPRALCRGEREENSMRMFSLRLYAVRCWKSSGNRTSIDKWLGLPYALRLQRGGQLSTRAFTVAEVEACKACYYEKQCIYFILFFFQTMVYDDVYFKVSLQFLHITPDFVIYIWTNFRVSDRTNRELREEKVVNIRRNRRD